MQQSHIRCKRTPDFQQWCRQEAVSLLSEEQRQALPSPDEDPVAFAEAVVRAWCGVASRSEFSPDTAAAFEARRRWDAMLRRYEGWRLERGRVGP